MAARPNTPPRPIIVKKVIQQAHGGHHGGAWKVAYADFVTAMMAFFLLMWLLGATNEKQRKALADYFAPTIVQTKPKPRDRTACSVAIRWWRRIAIHMAPHKRARAR